MLFRNALISTAIVLFAAGFSANAFAQAKKGDGPCAADAKKFCGNEKPGGGRIAKCMKSHETELSPACQSEMKRVEERIEQVREECKGDVEKFCKGVKPGAGRILSCLKGREADLAPACAAEFKRAGKR